MADKYGLPTPSEKYPLPWRPIGIAHPTANGYDLFPANVDEHEDLNGKACEVYADDRDVDFIVHAIKWIGPCRQLVVDLAEMNDHVSKKSFDELLGTAASLMYEMLKDAKGGG